MVFSVIRDARQWRYFKMLYDVTTPVEEQLFSTGKASDQPHIFLHPKESVHIPFRFLTFRADHSVPDQAPTDPYRSFIQSAAATSKSSVVEKLESRNVKVTVLSCYSVQTPFCVFCFLHNEWKWTHCVTRIYHAESEITSTLTSWEEDQCWGLCIESPLKILHSAVCGNGSPHVGSGAL